MPTEGRAPGAGATRRAALMTEGSGIPVAPDSGVGASAEKVRARLERLPGVTEVDLSGLPDRLQISCDASGARSLAAEAIKALLKAELGVDPQVDVGPSGFQGRARFESLQVGSRDPGHSAAKVVLDCYGKRCEGEAVGEATMAGDLRVAALAAARAVERVVDGALTFNLIGIKELHVFDHDLIAVLLHCPELPDRRLIGTSLITDDRKQSAVLAVLNATNRAVGTFARSEEG